MSKADLYGVDATEWLRRWDAGDVVWTIEMGGLGPGYEQAIQIAMSEILRFMLSRDYKASDLESEESWKPFQEEIETLGHTNERIKALGLSGAQWGAALNLAGHLYKKGPAAVMDDDAVKDRQIQVCRSFPVVP